MVPPDMDTGLIDDFGRPIEAGVALFHAPLAKGANRVRLRYPVAHADDLIHRRPLARTQLVDDALVAASTLPRPPLPRGFLSRPRAV